MELRIAGDTLGAFLIGNTLTYLIKLGEIGGEFVVPISNGRVINIKRGKL